MAWIKLSHGISSPFGLTIYRTIDIYGVPVKGRGRRSGERERERERVVKEVRRIGENLYIGKFEGPMEVHERVNYIHIKTICYVRSTCI